MHFIRLNLYIEIKVVHPRGSLTHGRCVSVGAVHIEQQRTAIEPIVLLMRKSPPSSSRSLQQNGTRISGLWLESRVHYRLQQVLDQ